MRRRDGGDGDGDGFLDSPSYRATPSTHHTAILDIYSLRSPRAPYTVLQIQIRHATLSFRIRLVGCMHEDRANKMKCLG